MFKQTKRIISMVLCLALVFSVFGMIGTQSVYAAFSDTRGHWAESVIDKWSAKGVLSGDGDGTFRPDDSITRAEFAKVIVTAKDYSDATGISYTDVSPNAWYYSYLTLAAAAGIIKGYEDGSFRPEAQITREEACAVISRAYAISGGGSGSFTDSAQISDWARTYVSQLSANNIIRGYEDGSFRPQSPITRAETVQILDRVSSDESLPTLAPDNSEETSTVAPDTSSMFGNGFSGGPSGPSGSRSTPKPSTSEYTVTFDSNGGSEVPTQKIRQGKNVEEPEEPSKDGYVFVGWLDKNSNYFEFDETVAEDITLKADWVKEINATEEEINELISKNISGEETIDIDNDSNKLIEEMGDSVKEKLKSGFTNQFKKYIKENIPNGENIVKAADKYNNLKKKFEKFVSEWNRDAGSDKTTKAYEQFKSIYENIEPLINNL